MSGLMLCKMLCFAWSLALGPQVPFVPLGPPVPFVPPALWGIVRLCEPL